MALAAGVLAAVLGTAVPSQAAAGSPTGGNSGAAAVAGSSAAGQYVVRAVPGHLDQVVAGLHAAGYRTRQSCHPSPAARRASDREGGRGLLLVDAIATAWGVDLHPDGKTVWFTLGRDAAARW